MMSRAMERPAQGNALAVALAALSYFGVVFACGFILGTLRILLI